MVRGFFVLLCLLLAVEVFWSSADPARTRKSHEKRGENDERIDHDFRGHKKQTRNTVQEKPSGQSEENENFLNLKNILFDREKLKKYVLDYLWNHQETETTTNREETISHNDLKQSGDHHNRLEPWLSSTNSKHRHLRHNNHEKHARDKPVYSHVRHSTPTRRTLSSKRTSHHSHSRHHLKKHQSSKTFPLPIYYSVKEENEKKNFIWDYPLSSSSKAKKRKLTAGGKHPGHKKGLNGSKRNEITRIKHNHKMHQERKNTNFANGMSSVRTIPYSHPHGKSLKILKSRVHKKGKSQHRVKLKHDLNDNKMGKNGLSHKKSNKRDFIAIVPPKAVSIEGFDVERIHPHSSHKKRKTVKSKTEEKHIHPEKSRELTPVAEYIVRRKSSTSLKSSRKHSHSVAKKSHRIGHHASSKVRKQKELLPQKAEERSRVVIKKSRTHKRKGSAHKSSRENTATRKSFVSPESSKRNHLHKHDNHHHGHKKSIKHGEKMSTAHKRNKTPKNKDSKEVKFSPSWKSLDKRKIPSWYDKAKFGIFVHWGLYSVPSFDNEWFWYNWKGLKKKKYVDYVEKNFPPGFSYNQFAPMFKAEFFDAKQWARLVARSGARYFVFTSKHHEGFTNWNSSAAWNWNSVDVGPHRNIVDELARAFRNLSDPHIKFGLYYSLYEWFNPHFLKDKANGFKTDEYFQAVVKPQLYDLINTYKPDYLWSDGDGEASTSYWKSEEFLAWLFNESPVKDTVVVNDRWGRGCRCRHGGVYTGQDRFNPGKLQNMKWENAMTIDRRSWGFRREANLKDYRSIEELIKQLVSTVSCGGNLLMNVGPAADGTIAPIFQERLTQMGDWLKVNGEAIYKTKPWRAQNDSVNGDVWYTSKGSHVFAIALKWPRSGKLVLGDPIFTSDETRVRMLDTEKDLKWTYESKHKGGKRGIEIHVPAIPVSELPCLWAWVFKLSHVK